jgi:hypothetical protein
MIIQALCFPVMGPLRLFCFCIARGRPVGRPRELVSRDYSPA